MSNADKITLILSFICAVLLWSYAKTVAAPYEKTREISDVPVILIGDSPPGYNCTLHPKSRQVSFFVRGPRDLVDSLTQEEVSIKVSRDNITKNSVITLDRSNINLPDGLNVLRYPKVTLLLEKLTQRTMPVSVSFITQPPPGVVVGQYVVTPSEVIIEGPEKAVASVAFLQVRLDPNKQLEGETQLTLHAVDDIGNQVTDVTIHKSAVIVKMVSLANNVLRSTE